MDSGLWLRENKSLHKLDVDYIDLYLVHQAYNDYYGAWKAIEELYEEGKIKAIGVCNFNTRQIVDLITYTRIKPAINQIEHNPFFQEKEIKPILSQYDVQLEAWAPFAEGIDDIFNHDTLKSIGQKYGKTVAQVILRWTIQRIEENYDIWDFELSQEDMEQIAELDKGKSSIIDFDSVETIEFLKTVKVHD